VETRPRFHYPKLVSHARYRWDKRREQHQLVFPEGVLVLNATAASIVQLLDGRRLVDLVAELNHRGPTGDVEGDVHEFIERLADKGLLCEGDVP